MGEGAGLSKANLQMVEVSLTEHTVLEEAQLPEEHLRHLSQWGRAVRLWRRIVLQEGKSEPTEGQTQQNIRLQLLQLTTMWATWKEEDESLFALKIHLYKF